MELTKATESGDTMKNGWNADGSTYEHYNADGAIDLTMDTANLAVDDGTTAFVLMLQATGNP